MTTYWTVVVMVIGAALLVLLAIWHQLDPEGRRLERRWVALGNSFTISPGSRSWAAEVALSLPAEAIDLTAPGAGITDVRARQIGPALAARPAVAVIWVGVADLLHGQPLVPFLRDLASAIGQLQRAGCAVLVVGASGVELPDTGPGRGALRSLRRSLEEWEAGIGEICRTTGAENVDLGWASGASWPLRFAGPTVVMVAAELNRAGQGLSGPIERALRDGGGPSLATGGWDEPADPVARDRLGLPPVR